MRLFHIRNPLVSLWLSLEKTFKTCVRSECPNLLLSQNCSNCGHFTRFLQIYSLVFQVQQVSSRKIRSSCSYISARLSEEIYTVLTNRMIYTDDWPFVSLTTLLYKLKPPYHTTVDCKSYSQNIHKSTKAVYSEQHPFTRWRAGKLISI